MCVGTAECVYICDARVYLVCIYICTMYECVYLCESVVCMNVCDVHVCVVWFMPTVQWNPQAPVHPNLWPPHQSDFHNHTH